MKKRFCKTFAMALVIGAFAASSGCGGQNGDSTSDEGMYISPAQEIPLRCFPRNGRMRCWITV
ncbi:MAG TPA: hypothetical protein IAB46_14980 [Candidatus Scybalocola faecigallinarum]|uniref:Lipoprotein n=1 Tax=Candidatus Scybalocola faecigallinarum TaxID=2840941 RepID=A0A9D1JS47_9FIRM|nr:hypothetical protein [Candidatus Scybalocola faecigallinarum]